jgi:hypothetical protein
MLAKVRTPSSPVSPREREREKEGGREMYNMVIFIFKRNDRCHGTF